MVMNHRMRLLFFFVCLSSAGLSVAQNAPRTTAPERLGYPASARLLVIHADDLGMNHSVKPRHFRGSR